MDLGRLRGMLEQSDEARRRAEEPAGADDYAMGCAGLVLGATLISGGAAFFLGLHLALAPPAPHGVDGVFGLPLTYAQGAGVGLAVGGALLVVGAGLLAIALLDLHGRVWLATRVTALGAAVTLAADAALAGRVVVLSWPSLPPFEPVAWSAVCGIGAAGALAVFGLYSRRYMHAEHAARR